MKFFGIFLSILFSLNLQAQSPFTNGQAYNWHVGDTLVYQLTAYNSDGYAASNYTVTQGFSVLSRQNFPDSIVYQIQYFDSMTPVNGIIYFADSLVGGAYSFIFPSNMGNYPYCADYLNSVDTLYYDPAFNYYARRDFGCLDITPFSFQSANYSVICGVGLFDMVYSYASTALGGRVSSIASGSKLLYYHSDSIIWTGIGSNSYYEKEQIGVYPNPVHNLLEIKNQSRPFQAGDKLNIFDMQERLVYSSEISPASSIAKVDFTRFESGMYLLEVKNNASPNIYRSKIIKQ
jgi:hypothetical protein